ncbi:hypothetical protein KP509_15G029800 [Ceratopteris richardii]|nr:hypothetical protein KP509_15G029800 [Ceratopteris richardii]
MRETRNEETSETSDEGLDETEEESDTVEGVIEDDEQSTSEDDLTAEDEYYEEHMETDDDDHDEKTLADFGSGWGRILFHPARRGKRVVLDVCCAANRNGTKGLFDRITLSKTTNRVLHFQASRSKWGDLWPCGDKRKRW